MDCVLCSDWISDTIVTCGYEPFRHRREGDHRPMIIDFQTDALFGTAHPSLTSPSLRHIQSKNKSSNKTYIETKYDYLQNHRFSQRLNAVYEDWDPEEAERLDRDWMRASKTASSACKPKPNAAFSKHLQSLRNKRSTLSCLLSQIRNGIDMSECIARFSDTPTLQLPETETLSH